MTPFIQTTAELRALLAPLTPPLNTPCACGLAGCTSWESVTEENWPTALLKKLATLRDPNLDEPTFEEFHPQGTRYESPDAPIALKFFPFNRCDIWHCTQCQLNLLRYTEFGGYYIDHRVRVLDLQRLA